MTKYEFEKEYAEENKLTVEWLHDHRVFAIPCTCGENGCKGWQMKYISSPNHPIDSIN